MELFPGIGVGARRVLALALILVVAVVLLLRHGSSRPATSLRVAPVRAAVSGRAAPAHAPLLVVDVAGAVRRPGLVRVSGGSRVADVIARAGGFTRRADQPGVNLAAPVSDGQQVLVPERGQGGAVAGSAAGGGGAGPVSLSAATAEQLDALPGIGPVTAQKILAYRQQHGAFHSVDELDAISGIGPSRIENLKGLVVP